MQFTHSRFLTLSLYLHVYTDINECDTGNGGCEHICNNQIGSYHCTCRAGYTLESDIHNCSGQLLHTVKPLLHMQRTSLNRWGYLYEAHIYYLDIQCYVIKNGFLFSGCSIHELRTLLCVPMVLSFRWVCQK